MPLQFQSNFQADNNSPAMFSSSPTPQQVSPSFTKGEPRAFELYLDRAYFWALCWHTTLL